MRKANVEIYYDMKKDEIFLLSNLYTLKVIGAIKPLCEDMGAKGEITFHGHDGADVDVRFTTDSYLRKAHVAKVGNYSVSYYNQ